MTVHEFIELMADGEVIVDVKHVGRKQVTIKIKGTGLVYETLLPLSWPDADCATLALGLYLQTLGEK